jgi:hypothetical protein
MPSWQGEPLDQLRRGVTILLEKVMDNVHIDNRATFVSLKPISIGGSN